MSIRDFESRGEAHTPSAYKAPTDVERPTVPPDGRPLAEQPKWRRDFPIDWPQDEYVSRRDLVKFIVLTSLAFATGQFWLLGQNLLRPRRQTMPTLPVAGVDELPVGGHKVFEYPEGSAPRLLIRTGEAAFVAYDQQCTHLLCPVIPIVAEGVLHCPCHHGVFDLATGRPVSGPPPLPLPRVTLEIRNGTVFATGMEERST